MVLEYYLSGLHCTGACHFLTQPYNEVVSLICFSHIIFVYKVPVNPILKSGAVFTVVLLFVFSPNLETVAIDGDTIAFSVMYKQW